MPTLSLKDTDIFYEVYGKGRPFLFCSATGTPGDCWKFYQAPEFSKDHQVIIFDQRGTGKSPVRSKDFTIPALASDAAALLDHLNLESAIVLGHSNGGRIAQHLALEYPHKVAKLILASSGGNHAPQHRRISAEFCLAIAEKGYERTVLDQARVTGFTRAYQDAHPDEVTRFLEHERSTLPPLANYLGHIVGRQEYDCGDRLKTLRVPTLILVGDNEDHGSMAGTTHFRFAQRFAQEIPNSRLVVLEGQGHYYYFSAPEETNQIIREFIGSS